MDRRRAAELETRYVRWPWCGREEAATLPFWYWHNFDRLQARLRVSTEALYRLVAAQDVPFTTIAEAVAIYLNRDVARWYAQKHRLVNDNDPYHPLARRPAKLTPDERARRRAHPFRLYTLPRVTWSPFKPIARARQFEPETPVSNT